MIILLFACIAVLFTMWLALLGASLSGLRSEKRASGDVEKKRPQLSILLMVPCKGNDLNLLRNLRSAMRQDYKNYRAIAIIESKNDPAYSAIAKAKMEFIIGDYKCSGSGKVKSLSSAIDRFKDYDAYCIMDSDVHVGESWLSLLADGLTDGVAISTSFPTFNPIGGFWSRVKHVWGFIGQSLMERESTRFAWGGSLLFKKELLGANAFRRFSSALSDDITLTNIAKEKGLRITYVPQAHPIVDCDDDFKGFIEW